MARGVKEGRREAEGQLEKRRRRETLRRQEWSEDIEGWKGKDKMWEEER